MELLSGRRFRVASHSPAAAYSGQLLRQLGAEVEHETTLDPERLGAYLGQGARFASVPSLQASAGVPLITDAPVMAANRERLEALAATSRITWLTPWGLDNPWSGRPASALLLQAAGGWMAAVGTPGEEPLGPPGDQALFVAGLFGAIAALAFPAGRGLVDVSMAEAVAATTIYDAVAFQYFGTTRERAGERFSHAQSTLVTLPCRDGWVGIHCALHGQWIALAKLIGHPELVSDPRFAAPLERAANIVELDSYLLPWLSERTRFQAYHELQAARIPASAHPTLDEVLASPQMAARDAWREVVTPAGRRLRVPGPVARVKTERGGDPVVSRPDGPWQPGALRVVDLSMGWAGPMVSYILAAFGADVIKLEGPTHFDWWRGSRPPGDDPELALHERSHVFNAVNRAKRGVAFDLAQERGRELARALLESADVVVENFSAGVLEKLGLSYERLSAANPGLIMLRQPGFGCDGPESAYVAFGNTIEGMSGLTAMLGPGGGPPYMMSNALGDPMSGLTGTIAVLAALHARARDGRGRLVECAQLEGFLPLVSAELIEYQHTGEIPPRRGNRRPGCEPSGLFRCEGEDQWAAIEVSDDAQWAALAALAGGEALDTRFATLPGREAERDRVRAVVAGWTGSLPREDVVEACLAAGVPAAPLFTEADCLSAEHLAAAGFWEGHEREVVGLHLYPSLPFREGESRPGASRPAPLLGQHTAEVLAALGQVEPQLRELVASGVI